MYKKRTSIVCLLCSIAVALLIFACADDGGGDGAGGGGTTSYDYVCNNGTPVSGQADNANITKCTKCDDGYYLDAPSESCKQGYAYICDNGTAATGPAISAGQTNCTACRSGYSLQDNACVLTLSGLWHVDTTPTCATTPACIVAMTDDGMVSWNQHCSTHAPLTSHRNYTIDNSSVIFSGTAGTIQHDFTVEHDAVTDAFVLNPHSTTLSNSRYLCPAGLGQLILEGAVNPDGASLIVTPPLITPPSTGTLHWILYADGVSAPTASEVIANAADDTVGIARSGANGIAISTNNTVSVDINGFDANTRYDLYVALAVTVRDTTFHLLSHRYDLTTPGYPYQCDNGTPASGEAQTQNTTKCLRCESGYFVNPADEVCTPGNAFQCLNGIPVRGEAPDAFTVKCDSCNDGYSKNENDACIEANPFVCKNGTPASGGSATPDTTNCQKCDKYYRLDDNNSCVSTEYVCDNGSIDNMFVNQVPFDNNEANTTTDVQACSSCRDYFRVDTDTNSCIPTVYTCDVGSPYTATTPFQDTHPIKNADVNRCSGCGTGYSLKNQACVLTLSGIWKFDSAATCDSTPACVVTLTDDGTVSWNANCTDHAPLTDHQSYTVDGASLIFSGTDSTIQHDFTVEQDISTGIFVMNPRSTTLSSNRYLCPSIGLSDITPVGNPTQTSASFTITPSDSGNLYWILYADGAPVPNAVTLIANADDSAVGKARSGATPIAVTADTPFTFSIDKLDPLSDYDLYAALSVSSGGATQQVISARYDLKTAGYPFVCSNGEKADGEAASDNITKCTSCNSDNLYLHGSGSCLAPGTVQDGYGLSANGVTITCLGVAVNDSFTVAGTTYTRRNRLALINDNDRGNAASACTTGISDMSQLFKDKNTFTGDISHWDTAQATNMSQMFYNADAFNQDISNWNTALVETMDSMFYSADSFDQDISSWNTAAVIDLDHMFQDADSFDRDLGTWDTSKVTTMESTFQDADVFNGILSGWNTAAVRTMNNMFNGALRFNQDISSWNVRNVTTMDSMFQDATAFNQAIGGWRVHRVGDMDFMFSGAAAFDNNLSVWCVRDIKNAPTDFAVGAAGSWMTDEQPQWGDDTIASCPTVRFSAEPAVTTTTPTSATISVTASAAATLYWIVHTTDTSYTDSTALKTAIEGTGGVARSNPSGVAVTASSPLTFTIPNLSANTNYRLYATLELTEDGAVSDSELSNELVFAVACTGTNAKIDNQCEPVVNFSVADNGKTITCDGVPGGTYGIINGDTNKIYVKRTKEQITTGNAANTCTSGIDDMEGLFYNKLGFNGDISHWDTSDVTTMKNMFRVEPSIGSSSFNRNIGDWDVSKVQNMHGMFYYARNFNQDIGNWDVGEVTTMELMFFHAINFNKNIGSWDVQQVTNMNSMFSRLTGTALLKFSQDLSQWCVSDIPEIPSSFNYGAPSWNTNLQPQWGVSSVNSCDVNFAVSPALSGNPSTSSTDVTFTPSKGASLYWILYTSPTTLTTSTDIKNAIDNNAGAKRSSVGLTVTDDEVYTIQLTDLTGGETYHLYTALEIEESGTVTESAVSEVVTFSTCDAYQHSVDGSCVATKYICTNGSVDSAYVGKTPMSEGEVNTTSDVQKCGGCESGYTPVDGICVPLETFTKAANGVTIVCDIDSNGNTFPVGTRGKVADDETVYVKRGKDQITITNAATTCTSGITDMAGLFHNQLSFNQDISHWDTSRVITMEDMFRGGSTQFIAHTFDQDISAWDVSKVRNMNSMFENNGNFNRNIGSWNVSVVQKMNRMFALATSFNYDIGGWDVSNVTDMDGMFDSAWAFKQNLTQWCIHSSITTKPTFFNDFGGLINSNLPQWGTTKGNNCTINFAEGPTIDGTPAATTTVKVTPSEDGKLYWILRNGDDTTRHTDTTTLIASINNSEGVQQASGLPAVDDTEQDIVLQNLTAGTYYLYVGVEKEDTDGTVLESSISNRLQIVVPSTP